MTFCLGRLILSKHKDILRQKIFCLVLSNCDNRYRISFKKRLASNKRLPLISPASIGIYNEIGPPL